MEGSEGLDINVPEPGKWLESQHGLRLDPSVMERSVNDLVDRLGPEGAVADVKERIRKSEEEGKDNLAAREEAAILVKRYSPLADDLRTLKGKLEH